MFDLAKSIASALTQVATGAAVDSTLRERIQLWSERAAAMQEDIARHADEKKRLQEEVKVLKEELLKRPDPAIFVSHRGVLWRKEGAGFGMDPYCPRCLVAMAQMPMGKHVMGQTINPVECSLCRYRAPFDFGKQLDIHKSLIV